MFNRIVLGTALGVAAAVAIIPSAASAQSLSVYVGQRYPAYPYYQRGYDEDRREAWRAHERWEQRERWEERARWEQEEARRRYWQERRERERHWRGDDGYWRGDDDDR